MASSNKELILPVPISREPLHRVNNNPLVALFVFFSGISDPQSSDPQSGDKCIRHVLFSFPRWSGNWNQSPIEEHKTTRHAMPCCAHDVSGTGTCAVIHGR